MILVTAGDPTVLRDLIADLTGAAITVWPRAPFGDDRAAGDLSADAPPSAERLSLAFAGVTAPRVLVVVGAGGSIDVIPLRN